MMTSAAIEAIVLQWKREKATIASLPLNEFVELSDRLAIATRQRIDAEVLTMLTVLPQEHRQKLLMWREQPEYAEEVAARVLEFHQQRRPCNYCGSYEHLTESPAGERCREQHGR